MRKRLPLILGLYNNCYVHCLFIVNSTINMSTVFYHVFMLNATNDFKKNRELLKSERWVKS